MARYHFANVLCIKGQTGVKYALRSIRQQAEKTKVSIWVEVPHRECEWKKKAYVGHAWNRRTSDASTVPDRGQVFLQCLPKLFWTQKTREFGYLNRLGSAGSRDQPLLVYLDSTLSSFLAFVPLETEEERQSLRNLHHLLPLWLCLIVNTLLFMFCDLPVLEPGRGGVMKESSFSSDILRRNRKGRKVSG